MICAVHAMLAAAVGIAARSRGRAFLVGVGTHLLADLVPHRDFSPPVEALMAVSALGVVGAVSGFGSMAFAGALGGVAPDLEAGLAAAGLAKHSYFPTHRATHGRATQETCSQVAIALAAFAFLLQSERRETTHRRAGQQ